jgi:MOSC domain-containing protein YiiM
MQVKAALGGIEGDKHSGMTRLSDGRTPYYPRGTEIRNDRQVSLVSQEELAQVAAALDVPVIQPEWVGANLLLQHIPHLTQLPRGTRLVFARGAVLIVEGENLPCIGPGKILEAQYAREDLSAAFPKAAMRKRGLVACVERAGDISEGDEVTAEIPAQVPYNPDA